MKLLCLHCDYTAYKPLKKALKSAPELSEKQKEGGRFENCLMVFASLEKGDDEKVVKKAAEAIRKHYETVKAATVLVYPYAHLSRDLAPPSQATELLKKFHSEVKKFCPEAGRSVFGYYKEFELKCKGHPLSELSKTIRAKDVEGLGGLEMEVKEKVVEEIVSDSLKAEEKVRSRFYILSPDGSMVSIKEFDFTDNEKLGYFAGYETNKERCYVVEPPHIKIMKEHDLVQYEPASDSGHFRWLPKGLVIKKTLEQAVSDFCVNYGAMQVETPIMYDFEHPALKSYLNRFPARQYVVQSDKKQFFLRFSACFGQFLLNHDMVISYKQLPFKMYELTHYSFRREQSGELCGLKRLRAFTMPDMHTLCGDLEQAKVEFESQYHASVEWNQAVGLEFETAFRAETEFFEENKDWYLGMVRRIGKPVLLELFDERYAYFITKFEFNFVDNMKKASGLSTVQIDVENAERYDLWYTDNDGSKRRPVILHASISGGIDRVLYALLEKQAERIAKGEKNPMLPLWLAPTQVRLVPVSDKHNEYCTGVLGKLKGRVRVDFDDRSESLGKKLREAGKEWIPFVAVAGDKELANGKLTVTIRETGEKHELTPEELAELVENKIKGKPFFECSLADKVSKRPLF